ncbi:unnamed protein product [Mytilus coruscus]|uniref:Uncharacterized protein n=1 Tax=Mytilus coruscus TaxID=42192 RepID=A0A6J8BNC8_MYTCO|nr:unnamed protein product [Mytilus coruscus]
MYKCSSKSDRVQIVCLCSSFADIPTTSDEATVQPKKTTIGDLLIPTYVTRHQQITSANYLSAISEGSSIRLQTYTSPEKLTMHDETTDLPHTTRPADWTTASNDLQSRLTNDNPARNDNSAVSTSTKSTAITSVHITSPLHIPISETCACNCPKASSTPSDNVLVTQLGIDKKTLSSYKRRQQSATDPRKSSFYIGCVGITVFSVTVGFIVLLDLLPRA